MGIGNVKEKTGQLLIRIRPSERAMLEVLAGIDGLSMSAELMHILKNRYREVAADHAILPMELLEGEYYTAIDKLVMTRYYYYLALDKFITKRELVDFCGSHEAVISYKKLLRDKHIIDFVEDI